MVAIATAQGREQEGTMTDQQVNRLVEHLCEQLVWTLRLKGTETPPPNLAIFGFDPTSVRSTLLTGLGLAGVSIRDAAPNTNVPPLP